MPGRREDAKDLGRRAGRGFQPVAQRLPLDQLHRDEDAIAFHHHVMHGDDVGVPHPGHELGFAHQPQSPLLRRVEPDIRPEHLERDLPIELRIVGCQHHAHAPGAAGSGDPIATEHRAGKRHVPRRVRQRPRGRMTGAHQRDEQLAATGAAVDVTAHRFAGGTLEVRLCVARQRLCVGAGHRRFRASGGADTRSTTTPAAPGRTASPRPW